MCQTKSNVVRESPLAKRNISTGSSEEFKWAQFCWS